MANATSTYLQITNATALESGADLASFATDGSDWSSNTTVMLNRFKTWVARAWKQIQVDNFDWEFMEEQGLCNLDPGIMFYTDGTPVSAFAYYFTNSTFDIYDQDGTVALSNITASNFVDLTGESTVSLPFGYFNFSGANLTTPLNIALKPGAEYFIIPDNALNYTLAFSAGPHGSGGTGFPSVNDIVSVAQVSYNNDNGQISLIKDYGPIATFIAAPASSGNVVSTMNADLSTDWVAASDLLNTMFIIYDNSKTVSQAIQFANFGTGSTWFYELGNNVSPGSVFTSISAAASISGKAFVHSWKSFDFNEETQIGDFQESIQEIDPSSFRIIDFYKGAPTGEVPLPFVPWNTFRSQYDLSSAYPGLPRIITEDADGRFRLYPAPYYRVSVKFDYDRQPQILSAYGDIPRGIDEDFVDLIMWRALIFYGEYDEQPSVVARATKNYKNLLARLELRNRSKFRFQPRRLY